MKLFVSYASEDRQTFVQPLVDELMKFHSVWFAPYELTLGDSLLQKISEALRECDLGVVILSPAFLQKNWPKSELDGLFALETTNQKKILPVWKDLTKKQLAAFSPIIASRLAVNASDGIPRVVEMINQAVDVAKTVASFSPIAAITSRVKAVATDIETQRKSNTLLDNEQGVDLLYQAANTAFEALEGHVQALSGTTLNFKVKRVSPGRAQLAIGIDAPYRLFLHLSFRSPINSAHTATLKILLGSDKVDGWGHQQEPVILHKEELQPHFDSDGKACWRGDGKDIKNETIPVYALDLLVGEIEKQKEKRPAN
jgi:hypothetical protein